MPHQPAPSYHGRKAAPSQSYYTSRGGESIRTYSPSQPTRGYRTAQPYNSNNSKSNNNNNGRDYYHDHPSEPPHYNQSQGAYHVPPTSYRRPYSNSFSQNRAQPQYRTHGPHHPEYREHETTKQPQPPQQGGEQRFYNKNTNSGHVHRNEPAEPMPTVVSSSYSHQSMTERQDPPSNEKEENKIPRALTSTSYDDTHESAEEVAVSALLLSAGGPPRSDSLSRTPSTSEPVKATVQNSYIQEQRLANDVAVKLEQMNVLKTNNPQEVANGQHTAAPQSPRIKIEETENSKALPSEVNFSHFPSILHKVLTSSEYSGKVLEWLPHGQAWRVLRWDEMAKSVLPSYFPNMCSDDESDCSERMNCFLWHVRSWGFQEVSDVGPDMGAFWHNCFIQGDANLCHQMHPYPRGGFSSKGNRKDQESSKVIQPTNSFSNAATITKSKFLPALSTNPQFLQRAPNNNDAMAKNESKSQSFRISNNENHGFSSPPRNNSQNIKPSGHLSTTSQMSSFSHKDSRYAVGLDRKRCISQDESSIVSTSPVKRRHPYRQDEDPQNVHCFKPPNKYYSSEVAHVARTPSWPTSNKGVSPSQKEHFAQARFNHYNAPYVPNHHGGVVPESPPYEMPKHVHKDAETRISEIHHIPMPFSATGRNTSHHSPNQVSPERAQREAGQRLRSGRGGARAYVPQATARSERRDQPEQKMGKLSVSSKAASNLFVSTRGKGSRASLCVIKNSSSHMSEPSYNPNQSVSELGIYGQKRRSLEQCGSYSSPPSMPDAVAVSWKTKRHRIGPPS